MATDRGERQRQAQELEEIRRSFAEMGARMGSLFEPTEADDPNEPERPQQAVRPAPPSAPPPATVPARPRWWWAAALVLLFVAGTTFGWLLPRGDSRAASPPPTQATSATIAPAPNTQTTAKPETRTSVPETCVEAAELADEVISRLDRNIRDNRLALALRDYTIASQACRREASS
jgi:hypothetical protein